MALTELDDKLIIEVLERALKDDNIEDYFKPIAEMCINILKSENDEKKDMARQAARPLLEKYNAYQPKRQETNNEIDTCIKEIEEYLNKLKEDNNSDKEEEANILGAWLKELKNTDIKMSYRLQIASKWILRKKCREIILGIEEAINKNYLSSDVESFFHNIKDILTSKTSSEDELREAWMALEKYVKVIFEKELKEFFLDVHNYEEDTRGLK